MMGSMEEPVSDPFTATAGEEPLLDLLERSVAIQESTAPTQAALPQTVVGEFVGFALDDQPLVRLPSVLPGEVVHARTSVPLRQDEKGSSVVVVFENGQRRQPIIIGRLLDCSRAEAPQGEAPRQVSIQADDDRYVVTAEREIVLRCGDASITLTRAGKVIIKGHYIITRSTGANKIKGAVVDIN